MSLYAVGGKVVIQGGGAGSTPAAGAPAWFTAMTDKTWNSTAVTNNLDSVKPSGAVNQNNICDAYAGACANQTDGELMISHNGGHSDYSGNETYACKLTVASPAWVRLTNPSTPTGGDQTEGSVMDYGDGLRVSDHGYNRHMFGNGKLVFPGVDGASISASYSKACYFMDRATLTESFIGNPALGGAGSGGWEGGPAAFDPSTGLVWSAAGYATANGVYSVDTVTGTITNYNLTLGGNPFHYAWSVIANGCWIVASFNDARFYVLDLSNPNSGFSSLFPSGSPTALSTSFFGSGAVYHPASGAILCYLRSMGTNLYKCTVPASPLSGSYVWSQVTPDASNTVNPASGSVGASYQGCFSKFNIINNMGNGQSALVLVESTTGSTYAYKLPSGGV